MIKKQIEEKLRQVLGELRFDQEVFIERPIEEKFGDYTTPVALRLAGKFNQSPMEIARQIESNLKNYPQNYTVEIITPGYINFRLKEEYLQNSIAEVIKQADSFGYYEGEKKQKIQIEFISANPTGPLTLGNGRGAFLGDSLARIFEKRGFEVEREYYINDRGVQVDILAESVAYAVLGSSPPASGKKTPDYLYKGDYIESLAQELASRNPKIAEDPLSCQKEIKKLVLPQMVDQIKEFVKTKLKISFDSWFYESSLYLGEVDEVLQSLDKAGLTYRKDGSLWFRSTKFGDEKNRVIIKEDGESTYFLSDIAYHKNKFSRGFKKVIDIWGADHHGYVPRFQASMEGLGFKEKVEVIIVQLVHIFENGKQVRMSKRGGTFLTLEEIIDEIGLDATRFFFLSYQPNTHLDFDLNLAKQKTKENPLYYVQYAHARMCSILKKAGGESGTIEGEAKTSLLKDPSELDLIRKLIYLPELIDEVSKNYSVHNLVTYSISLADYFHRFYESCQVLGDDKDLTSARLSLVQAIKVVLKETLNLIGVTAPEKM